MQPTIFKKPLSKANLATKKRWPAATKGKRHEGCLWFSVIAFTPVTEIGMLVKEIRNEAYKHHLSKINFCTNFKGLMLKTKRDVYSNTHSQKAIPKKDKRVLKHFTSCRITTLVE